MTKKYIIINEDIYDCGDSYCNATIPSEIITRDCKKYDDYWYKDTKTGERYHRYSVFDTLQEAEENFKRMFISIYENECIPIMDNLERFTRIYNKLEGHKHD